MAENDSVIVACPACLAPNRIPRARLAQAPVCGRCRQPVLPAAPLALAEASFDAYVGRTQLPVVVDFWAPWCGPCRAMAPSFEQIAAELGAQARFAKVNTDEAAQLGARFAIRSIPTLIVFREGRELARASGALDMRSLRQFIAPHL